MTDYTLSRTLTSSYDDALAAVRAELAEAGFGVITEIDMAATLKKKLDVDVPPQIILGACRPQLAYEAIQAEPSISALLPCNVVVRSVDDTTTIVEAVDPHAMMSFAGADLSGEALRTVAEDAHTRLVSALDALSTP